MANVTQAVDAVLRQEDSTLSGVITNEASDCGGLTRFGLCAKFHQALVTAGFYDAARVPKDQALTIAEQTYAAEYGKPLYLDGINDQGVATALLSFAVNDGQHQAVLLLQRAANTCGATLEVDGAMGPNTLRAVNSADSKALVQSLCALQTAFYQSIVDNKASQKQYLAGWLNRVSNVQKICAACSTESA